MFEGPAQYPATAVPEHCEVARHFPLPLGVEQGGAVQHLMSLDPVPFQNRQSKKLDHKLTSKNANYLPGQSPEVTVPPLQQPPPMLTQTPL
jgi:hypothetical protein